MAAWKTIEWVGMFEGLAVFFLDIMVLIMILTLFLWCTNSYSFTSLLQLVNNDHEINYLCNS